MSFLTRSGERREVVLRKRLAGLVMCLSAAALLLPATPAAATKCAVDDVVADTVRCTRLHICWETGICV